MSRERDWSAAGSLKWQMIFNKSQRYDISPSLYLYINSNGWRVMRVCRCTLIIFTSHSDRHEPDGTQCEWITSGYYVFNLSFTFTSLSFHLLPLNMLIIMIHDKVLPNIGLHIYGVRTTLLSRIQIHFSCFHNLHILWIIIFYFYYFCREFAFHPF